VTWIFILICVALGDRHQSLSSVRGLEPLPCGATPVVVGQRVAQNATKPSVDLAAVLPRLPDPDYLEAELLKGVVGILRTAQALPKKAQEFGSALDQTLDGGSVGSDASR
jgi:hypothetical protein